MNRFKWALKFILSRNSIFLFFINMEKFRHLKLSEGMLNTIKSSGFSEPSEIQEKTIPLVMEGKDVIGSSVTGSGKTLAFGGNRMRRHKNLY